MKNYLLRLLDPTRKHQDFANSAASAMEELAEDLEEAVYNQDRSTIDALSRDLMDMSSSLIRKLHPRAKAIVSGKSNETTEFDLLYVVGQLAFAQHFASVIAAKRPQKDFMSLLEAKWAMPYIDALYNRDLSSSQLAEAIGAKKETVSRNLGKLREAGVTDFKKKGASTINFLTSAAAEVWKIVINEQSPSKIDELKNRRTHVEDGTNHDHTVDAVQNMLKNITGKNVPDYMNKMPTMDTPA